MPVGVQATGWNGVGVGDALGAAVTRINGNAGCFGTGARVPHPTSRILARSMMWKNFRICYGYVAGVLEAVNVGIAVGGAMVAVCVGKLGTIVTPGMGVRVGMLGTQST